MRVLRSLPAAIALSAVVAGSLLTASQAGAATTPAGSASFRVNLGVSQMLLREGIYLIGQSPAGGTQIEPGKLAYSLPVTSVASGVATAEGGLVLVHGTGAATDTVVLSDLAFDMASGKVTGSVWAQSSDLGTMTLFTMAKRPGSSSSAYLFTLKTSAKFGKIMYQYFGCTDLFGGARMGSGVITTTQS